MTSGDLLTGGSDCAVVHQRKPPSDEDGVPERIERELAGPTVVRRFKRAETEPYRFPRP